MLGSVGLEEMGSKSPSQGGREAASFLEAALLGLVNHSSMPQKPSPLSLRLCL